MARNLAPKLATGICPMAAMCGRADVFSGLGEAPQLSKISLPGSQIDQTLLNAQNAINQMFNIRNDLVLLDARRAVEICGARKLRAGSQAVAHSGDIVDIFMFKERIRKGNFRLCGQVVPHGVVEKEVACSSTPCDGFAPGIMPAQW